MKNLISFLFSFFFAAVLAAQPGIQWKKCFGGPSAEQGYAISPTSDGGYIVVGTAQEDGGIISGTHGALDIWIVKVSSANAIEWQRIIGGSDADYAYSIAQTSDQGYIIAGYTKSNNGDISGNHGSFDILIIKLDSAGAVHWQKVFGGSSFDFASYIQQTSDGGYLIAGTTYSNDGDVSGLQGFSDAWVLKLDQEGDIEWQKLLNKDVYTEAVSIQPTSDGGYLMCGSSFDNNTAPDTWVVRLDSARNIIWEKSYGGNKSEAVKSVQQTADGGIALACITTTDTAGYHGEGDILVIKLNATGDVQWQKWLGGSVDDEPSAIIQTTDGGFVIIGNTLSNNGDVAGAHGSWDVWVVKLDNEGNFKWQKALGGGNIDLTHGTNSIAQTPDGGYLLTAGVHSVNGDVMFNHGQFDFWVVKFAPESVPTAEPATKAGVLEVYPNPAAQSITVSIASGETLLSVHITDLLGREVLSQNIHNGSNLDVSALSDGLYLVSATTTDGKVILQKLRKQG